MKKGDKNKKYKKIKSKKQSNHELLLGALIDLVVGTILILVSKLIK